MTDDFFYCSELSRNAREKTFGTGSTGDTWFLLDYPYPWGYKALHDSGLAPPVKTYLNTLVKAVPRSRVLFVKRDLRLGHKPRIFVVRCSEKRPSIVRFVLKSYMDLLDLDLASVVRDVIPATASVVDHPMYLVCTHGRRDKCCAKFGYPLYKSIRAHRHQETWQSSHVGGDRFAANLVCFPHGLFFAHVTEATGKKVIDEYEAGKMSLDGFRGRACYSQHVQAAEFFVRCESELSGVESLSFDASEKIAESVWRVWFRSEEPNLVHETTVFSVPSEFKNRITCAASQAVTVPQFALGDYRVVV